MCLIGYNAVLAMALSEDFGGDELAEVNLAKPRVVAGRTDLPTSVRKQADALLEHTAKVAAHGIDEGAEFAIGRERIFQAEGVRNDKPLDRRNDATFHILVKDRGEEAIFVSGGADGCRRAAGLIMGDGRALLVADG